MAIPASEASFLAHTPNGRDWDYLVPHLRRVAELSRQFGKAIGAEEIASTIGLWHDLGKLAPEFQHYIREVAQGRQAQRAPHSVLGALFAHAVLTRLNLPWQEIALSIAGHHSGLADRASLEQELLHAVAASETTVNEIRRFVNDFGLVPESIERLQAELIADRTAHHREMLVRMLLSALRDADWLATEEHFSPDTGDARRRWPSLAEVGGRFESARRQMFAQVPDTALNSVRIKVHKACIAASSGPRAIYRLTVPTGGGKTLSSLAFALGHAETHALRRVIVALPYTSIIDQTARVYRDVLGADAVLEHHSQVEAPADEDESPEAVRLRLATENWDAPVIVTTTVQLFESLMHRRTSRVRKIHNIAGSVLILDEVQTLPPGLLAPINDVLKTLVDDYGVTLVLSTATQPAFEGVPGLRELGGIEIVPGYREHFEQLRRVEYRRLPEPVTWEQLAKTVSNEARAMVVLNTRRDAMRLIDAFSDERRNSAFHLSALLCGVHRRKVLDDIKSRLNGSKPVLLISTQVVEAGVDISFPVVFRAVGPLDRIVQAAGRCNREGELPGLGSVVIFEAAEGGEPRGPYKVGIEKARLLLRENPPESLHDPDFHREYFRRLYADLDLDKHGIQASRERLDYPTVAQRFRMIEEDTVPVVVPYEEAEERLATWREKPSRRSWQRLQPYIVGVHDRERRRFEGTLLQQVSEGLYFWTGKYDDRFGLKEVMRDPSDLVVIPPEELSRY